MTNSGFNDAQLRWYVTTAIPYVNAKPHIGFALEAILTDTLARYHQQRAAWRQYFITSQRYSV